MKTVIQRVSRASVEVDGQVIGCIEKGLVVLLGIAKEDGEAELDYLVDKIAGLRVFADDQGKMNLSIAQVGGHVLMVSQFTLLGDVRKGRRPVFDQAAAPDRARVLYDTAVERLRARGVPVETGRFGAHMKLDLVNDGPVTFILDSAP